MLPNPLMQVLLIPLLSTPLIYLYARRAGKYGGYAAAIPLAYTLLLLLALLNKVLKGASHLESYTWAPGAALTFGLLADGLSIWMLLTINLLSLLVSIYSVRYMEHRFEEHEGDEHFSKSDYANYYTLYMLYVAGMMGTVMATNLIEFYLFYELMLIPSWLLINNYGYGERERIGMMYFLWTHVGAVILLVGLLSAYWVTGSFEISALPAVASSPNAPLIAVAILIGCFTKMAVFGLHIWLPYAHAEAPTPISALLSPAMIGIGAYAATRLVLLPMSTIFSHFTLIFSIWALVTMVYGGLMALAQDDVKRFLAYSSISQMGYIFLGMASVSTLGVSGAMFHYVSHGLGKCILFCVAGILITQVGTRSMRRMGGLADRMPLTATLALIGVFSIAGVPPTAGFMSKWLIFSGVFDSALPSLDAAVFAAVSVIMTVLTVGYTMWMIRRVFFGPLPEGLRGVREAPPVMTAPLIILAAISLILGVYPRLITDSLLPLIGSLLG